MPHRKVFIIRVLQLCVFLQIAGFDMSAQVKNLGLPYIINYTPEQYQAAKQNWSIVEDKRGIVYFGNTTGVLEFDGQNWRLISLPNNSIVRSLAVNEKGIIFVGSRSEFGFLKPDSIGSLKYVSLSAKIEKEEYKKFGDISRIFVIDGKVYFTCEEFLFEYHNGEIKPLKLSNVKQFYEARNRIFVRMDGKNGGLGELKDGKLIPIQGTTDFKDRNIRAVLPYGDDLLFVTMSNGLFIFENDRLRAFETEIDKFLEKEKVVSSIALADGNYAFGMFSSGLLIIDKQGSVIQHLTMEMGLQSELISNIMQDSNGNLWLSKGNGISYVLTSLPISIYGGLYDLNSTVYAAFKYMNYLYAASETGLLYRNWGNSEMHLNRVEKFRELGDPMNIWSIDTFNSVLLVATNLGISVVENNKISDINLHEKIQVWKFLRVNGNPDLLLAGTNKGFILLEFVSGTKSAKSSAKGKTGKSKAGTTSNKGKWTYKQRIKGFSERCRHVEIDANNNIWFSDKAKGVAKLIPISDFDSISPVWYNENKGLPTDGEYVFNIKDEILVGTDLGLYKYNTEKDNFQFDENWNTILPKGAKITLMVEDNDGNIWFKQQRKNKLTKDEIFELGQLVLKNGSKYSLNMTPFYNVKNNIHSISPFKDGSLIIGTDKGFLHYDPRVVKDYSKPYAALIRKVEFVSNDSLIFDGAFADENGNVGMTQTTGQVIRIPYRFHNIRFTFSTPFFDSPEDISFKYYLENNDDGWSDWKSKNFKEYSNLLEGNYRFHVIAKNIYEIESTEAIYEFSIAPPWYRTVWAYIAYVIFAVFLVWGIVRLSVRRLRIQKEHLEQVVEERTAEIRMKNVELEQQKEEIMAQRDEIEVQKDKIEEKNKNITASITYAKRIQDAMLPLREKIDQAFDDYFILFKPRDIVSGDFYWFNTRNNKIIFTAVDCTGHGVPGAFMSMIGSEILSTVINQGVLVPAEILDYMNRYVRKALKQDQTENQDGMDMSLCIIDKQAKTVEWAGAKNPMIYIQNNELFHLKGDAQSIGGHQLSKKDRQYTNYVVSYADGPTYFYIFTDGYQDQFGGGKTRKFMVKSMKDMFFEYYKLPMVEQHQIYEAVIQEWKKNVEQTDDILVIGFKLSP